MMKILITLLLVSSIVSAQDVEVPADELATETVYPVFDQAKSIKNRNVQTTSRIDVGIFGGLALTEPIANTTKVGLALNYHFNEYHSLGGFFVSNSSGLSKDAEGLRESNDLDFTRAPQPKTSFMLDYNYKPFYGKMSITKNGVINTTIYGSASLGMIQYQHKSYPAIALGIGERFYFTNRLSLKTDLRLFAHNAPSPFLRDKMKISEAAPSYDEFNERITYTTNLEVGLNFLF